MAIYGNKLKFANKQKTRKFHYQNLTEKREHFSKNQKFVQENLLKISKWSTEKFY